MVKKAIVLEPADPMQCQHFLRIGPFTLGGKIGSMIRCHREPTVIARENHPAADGLIGSMSLCDEHKEILIQQLGEGFATITPINAMG
jgi:hypothetical protein